MKRYKKETCDTLEIGHVYYNRRFELTVDKNLCKGCVICKLICPREAITLKESSKGSDGRAITPTVDIDENKCDFHGICAVACPFSAIKITIDGKKEIPAVEKGVFPVLTRDIEIDSSKCEQSCKKCEEKCPLGIISVKFESSSKGDDSKTVVDVNKELCAGCQICWEECPTDALKVTKFYDGSIRINQELCPETCQSCLDVCPVNALYLGDDKKVYINDNNCIYCGTCETVCPKPEALDIKRISVRHSPIDSGAWNKGLEKITSTEALNKELAAKRADKVRAAVNNLK